MLHLPPGIRPLGPWYFETRDADSLKTLQWCGQVTERANISSRMAGFALLVFMGGAATFPATFPARSGRFATPRPHLPVMLCAEPLSLPHKLSATQEFLKYSCRSPLSNTLVNSRRASSNWDEATRDHSEPLSEKKKYCKFDDIRATIAASRTRSREQGRDGCCGKASEYLAPSGPPAGSPWSKK